VANKPITDDDRRRVRSLHAAGRNRNQIAKELSRSGSTVSKIAAEFGLSFDRDAVKAATVARVADAKARRAELMHALLDDAQRLRQQLFAPTTIHSFGGKDNTYASRDVNQPLFKDQRDIMQATNTAITASLRIDDHDTDTGADGAKSMIGALFAGLQGAYDQLQDQADDDDRVD
jgi:hypothetical protein